MKKNTANCAYCGNEFERAVRGRKRIYCCEACSRKAQAKQHYTANKEQHKNYNAKGYLSKEIINRYGGRCAICGWRASEDIIETPQGKQYAHGNEIHHILSVKDGGEATESNLILLCPNHHKQANLGIITREELSAYIKTPPTDEEKQQQKNRAVDTIAKAIFAD